MITTTPDLSPERKAKLEAIMTADLPPWGDDEVANTKAKNRRKLARLNWARDFGDGYLLAHLGGQKIHAADSTIRGWGGHIHVRTMCQPHSPRSYAGEYDPLGEQAASLHVTCGRCLASMAKKGL